MGSLITVHKRGRGTVGDYNNSEKFHKIELITASLNAQREKVLSLLSVPPLAKN